MSKLTKQQVFDAVVAHAREQGRQATDGRGQCTYRAPNGDKCFIGALIPDEIYTPAMDGIGSPCESDAGMSAPRLLSCFPEVRALFACEVEPRFLAELQGIHDNSGAPEQWEGMFSNFARNHGLIYTHPAVCAS